MAAALPSRALPAGVSIATMVTLAASALLLLNAFGDRSPARLRTSSLATMSLTGDAGGSLFNARALVPGHPVSNCIQIVNRGQGGGDVRLTATDLTGTLISGLRLRVDLGTGGEIGDCTGFHGAAVYDGLLTGLTADESGVSTGWTPAAEQTKTFRLTVEVLDDDALQATTGGATLSWRLTPRPTVTSTNSSITESRETPSPSGPTPLGTAAPASAPPSRTGTGSSAPTSQGQPSATIRPSATSGPSATSRPSATSSSPPVPGTGDSPAAPEKATTGWRAVLDTLATAQKAAWNLFVATARHPWYLLFSLAVMWIFLFFTDRVGLRDPKLALAPVTRDPYLRFPAECEDDSGDFN